MQTSGNTWSKPALREWKKIARAFPGNSGCICSNKCDETCLNRSMGYECNENNCAVENGCTNRRIFMSNENGLRTEAFDAGLCGKGLRATESLEPDDMVTEYTGEIITTREAKTLLPTAYKWDIHFYLMGYGLGIIFDATKRGSNARYKNHNCDPNCYVEMRISESFQPRCLIFTKKGINPPEELKIDYGFEPLRQKPDMSL